VDPLRQRSKSCRDVRRIRGVRPPDDVRAHGCRRSASLLARPVQLPDDDPRASFALFDSQARSIRFHRVAYDRPAVMAQTRAVGLIAPQRLAWLCEDQRTRLKAMLRRWGAHDFLLAVFDALDRRRAPWERRRP
jgi:diadenosine tetraphosphatase ApaH/serine/threonine PP2A family protein phosphatase